MKRAIAMVLMLVCIMCAGCAAAEYVYQRSYVEEFLLMLMGEMLPDKTVSLDIMAPAAVRPGLTAGSQTLGVVLTVALPLLIIMIGLIVLLPRRSR